MGILESFTKKYGPCEKKEHEHHHNKHEHYSKMMHKAEGERIPPVKAYAKGGGVEAGGTPSRIMKKGCRV